MITPIAPSPAAKPTDFADLVALLDKLTSATNQLDKLQQTLDAQHLDSVRGHMPAYKEIQQAIGECEAAIQVIAERNPQWFADKKSVGTPVGEVKRTTSISLSIADPEITKTLIKAAGRAADFIRVSEDLRVEVLETLADEELGKLGVKRITEHNYKVAAAGISLGKAVKAAEKSEKAAAKTAKKAVAS